MAASDALSVPTKNQAYREIRVVFYNATTGLPITGWTSAAATISQNGGSFTATTNTPTEIGSSGFGYIDYTSGEFNADQVQVIATIGNTDAIPAFFPYPLAGNINVNVTKILGTAVATPATAGILDVNVKNINNVTAATPGATGGLLIAGANAATTFATVTISGATSLAAVGTGNITVTGGLSISTTVAIGSTVTIVGATNFNGGINVTGNFHLVNDFNIDGATTFTGAVSATSASNDIRGAVLKTGSIASATFAAGATIPRVTLADTLTTYTGNTVQTGDSFARIGSAGVGLTAASSQVTSDLATAHGAGSWLTATGFATSAQAIKLLAATYDSAALSGSIITLSNGTTQTVTTTGRVTSP